MKLKKSKAIKWGLIIFLLIFIAGIVVALSMYYMPHRDIQSTSPDYTMTVSQLTEEYLEGSKQANEKYLSEDGESKILLLTGMIKSISENLNGQKVLLLKEAVDKAGINFTFVEGEAYDFSLLKIGQEVSIKGVIRSGASYDEDLEMYENTIIEKSTLIK